MSRPFIFISCGQFTDAEKSLGKSIASAVKSITGLNTFFAEEVHDLNGLDSSILESLRDATAFITVLHPRGTIKRPDGSTRVRASVWIEQEIAIATYIQRVEKRPLPVIAFIHDSVGREGLRDLLHLNPITFSAEEEVFAELPRLLETWKGMAATGIGLLLESERIAFRDGHWIYQLKVSLVNDTNNRLTKLNGVIRVPAGILKHWSSLYPSETNTDDPRVRAFRVGEEGRSPIWPHATEQLMTLDYCPMCAADQLKDDPLVAATLVDESEIEATVWIEGREYAARRSLKELAMEAERR